MDKNGEVRKEKLSPESFLYQFSHRSFTYNLLRSKITTSQLSDALRNVTGENGVLVGIKPVKKTFKIIGMATTIKTSANDWGTVINGIYRAKKGDILVICCDNDDSAVWGELASNAAQKQGLTGTVIYGSSRDVAGIKKLNYPVFSRDIIPNAGKPLDEGAVNITVNCGSTTINPGDFIMGDECGVVCVPKEITEEILREAYKIVDNEDHIVRQLDSGRSFLDILGFK